LRLTRRTLWDEGAAGEEPCDVSDRVAGTRDDDADTRHDELEGSPATASGVAAGWSYVLSGLQTLVETGRPLTAASKETSRAAEDASSSAADPHRGGTRRPKMEFDSYTIVLLVRNQDGPKLAGHEADAMQDSHLAHLAHLADAGHLLAAGPLRDDKYAGLSILDVPPEEALVLKAPDPAVRAGLYLLHAMPWQVPGGAIAFQRTRFPRSIAEALNDE
jgi:uncharacterized protein YciI